MEFNTRNKDLFLSYKPSQYMSVKWNYDSKNPPISKEEFMSLDHDGFAMILWNKVSTNEKVTSSEFLKTKPNTLSILRWIGNSENEIIDKKVFINSIISSEDKSYWALDILKWNDFNYTDTITKEEFLKFEPDRFDIYAWNTRLSDRKIDEIIND